MSRRKARVTAFQALYSWDVGGTSEKDVLELAWLSSDSDGEETERPAFNDEAMAFIRMLIAGTIENIARIDELIKKHLTNWEFDRVNRVTVAILRMSVYSMLFIKDIAPLIVIDEAVDIAKNYGPDDSYKFVNAILDNIKKSLQL